MGLKGGMGWPVRYMPPVEDMQDMQTPSSDTKGPPLWEARCAVPKCKMPQILVIAALSSWVVLSIVRKMLASRLRHEYDIARSHIRNAQYN